MRGTSCGHLMRHLMRGLCLRFAARIAPTPRKTRFRLVASLCRAGSDPRGSLQSVSAHHLHSFLISKAFPGAMARPNGPMAQRPHRPTSPTISEQNDWRLQARNRLQPEDHSPVVGEFVVLSPARKLDPTVPAILAAHAQKAMNRNTTAISANGMVRWATP